MYLFDSDDFTYDSEGRHKLNANFAELTLAMANSAMETTESLETHDTDISTLQTQVAALQTAVSALQTTVSSQASAITTLQGYGKIVYQANISSNSSGLASFTAPEAGLKFFILPRTAGDFTQTVTVTGSPAVNGSIQFKKVKGGTLGITLGLLDVSAFEASAGTVNFDIIGVRT